MIDRRDFLKTSTLVGVGTGVAACAGQGDGLLVVPSSSLTAADMETYLARLDRAMNDIATKESPIPKLFPTAKLSPADPGVKEGEDLMRKNLRSLLLVGSFKDLPEEGRAYPGMQARMWNAMTEMDDAMLGTHRKLTAMTPTERADIGRALKADPGLGMRIIEAFDQEAASHGLPMERRLHLRSLGAQVTSRLKQSSTLFIDEYTTKAEKLIARSTNVEDVQRHLLATLGEQEFFAMRERNFQYAEKWRLAQATPPTAAAPGAPLPYGHTQQQQAKTPPGAGAVKVGGILLGLGAIIFLLGVIIAAGGSEVGLVMGTVGALLGIGGLITLIVGAIINASAD
jgi:hypothetical protein